MKSRVNDIYENKQNKRYPSLNLLFFHEIKGNSRNYSNNMISNFILLFLNRKKMDNNKIIKLLIIFFGPILRKKNPEFHYIISKRIKNFPEIPRKLKF